MTTTASVSKRSRRCKNGYRNVARSLVAPNPGMVSKIGGKTGIPCVPGNVGRPRGGPRDRGIGAPTRASTGHRRGLVETSNREDYLPRPGYVRTTFHLKPNRKRPPLSLSRSFVSRPKFRVPLEISSRARSSYSIGSLPFVFFVSLCRGDAVAMVDNNTPNFGMTGRFSRPKWRKNDNDRECVKALPEV
jgi:hypothetical protein